ncbi:MAG: hypothetical protein ACTSWJ_11025 [Candidatus Heimdallarchaeaceae archaeon]
MPEKPEDLTYTPTRLYDIRVRIKDLDYTQDLVRVEVNSSLSTSYQVVDLLFFLDPNDIILEELYGGDPIKLSIFLLREEKGAETGGIPGPELEFELMYVNHDFPIVEKSQYSQFTQKDRVAYKVTSVTRKPYKIMTSLVNKVFLGTTLSSVISDIGKDAGATSVEYDSDGQNKSVIDQVIIPPTTFYQVIKEFGRLSSFLYDGYLDGRFGLFNGVPGVFCQYDGKVYIKNLTSKMKKKETFTVYQFSQITDKKESDRIMDSVVKGDVFYTYDTIQGDYSASAKFSVLGTDIYDIVKPKDTLTDTIVKTLNVYAEAYSLIYQNPNLFLDSNLDRKRYYTEDTGNETEETQFNSRYARVMADTATLSINLERDMPLLQLIQVGEAVNFKPLSLEYQKLSGKYILWSSSLLFQRSANWESAATVNLIRTNRDSGQLGTRPADTKKQYKTFPEKQAREMELKLKTGETQKEIRDPVTITDDAEVISPSPTTGWSRRSIEDSKRKAREDLIRNA